MSRSSILPGLVLLVSALLGAWMLMSSYTFASDPVTDSTGTAFASFWSQTWTPGAHPDTSGRLCELLAPGTDSGLAGESSTGCVNRSAP